ncbi:MAG TPA: protein-L-isoaspartate(D-aspartate) O-methyltransferase [Pyrinomonadaceae bacterium]|nr:protein-L-isoaspartate(D-aspartate) O-methyltransferase [Pyrinomonadaceae bacterium]
MANISVSRTNITDEFAILRLRMVQRLHDHYHIGDKSVLDVMNKLPRHLFVPEALRSQAYKDNALPIASGQTISQPYIVARMTEILALTRRDKVLEIGSGSGYQTAVLAALSRSVFAVERLTNLAAEARERLKRLGIYNVSIKCDDGTSGWDAYAPYDAILVAAGGPEIPQPLIDQLKIGGRLVIPIGADQKHQNLVRAIKTETGIQTQDLGPCAFVPLIGEHGWQNRD